MPTEWSPIPPRWNGGVSPGRVSRSARPARAQNAATSYAARSASGPAMPYPVISPYTRRGLRPATTSKSSPSRRSAAGRTLVTNTSASARSSNATRRPSSVPRSSTMLRLDRLSISNGGFTPDSICNIRPNNRAGSPVGGSILTTSAPQSARMPPAAGAATHTPSSTTLIPVSGPGNGQPPSIRDCVRPRSQPPGTLRSATHW
jgi:hypothetical protein